MLTNVAAAIGGKLNCSCPHNAVYCTATGIDLVGLYEGQALECVQCSVQHSGIVDYYCVIVNHAVVMPLLAGLLCVDCEAVWHVVWTKHTNRRSTSVGSHWNITVRFFVLEILPTWCSVA
jgi:hypothetical protein